MFKCSELCYFVLCIYEDAHSVRFKLLINIQMLTPEKHTFEVALRDFTGFSILRLQDKLIIGEVLDLIIEMLILFEAVSDIFIQISNFLLNIT